jgi:hypothetical protein
MGRALIMVGWLATAGLAATGWLGFWVRDGASFEIHVLLGLASVLLLLFSHSWIMFYLIGTGKAVKEAVARCSLEARFVQETKDLKNLSYPILMLATGMAMATFIVGGGVATKLIPAWIHQLLFWATLLVQLRALLREGHVLARNRRLMAEVESLAEREGGGE